MAQQTLTVVFTDIAGFARKAASRTRDEVLGLLERHEALLLPVVEHFRGRVIKTLGDAFLLVFEDPTDAVLAGVMMQVRLREYNEVRPEDEWIRVRVAVHTGDVDVIDQGEGHIDVFGDAVHIGSRIEALTQPGEIFFTEATYQAMDQSHVPTSEVGEFRLKGIHENVRVYKVIQDQHHERYRALVESVDLPEADPSAIGRGVYSRSLLYGLEQQRATTRSRWGVGPWILATAVLLVLAAGGVLATQASSRNRARRKAARLVKQGEPQQALAILVPLREQDPTDIRVLDAISDAVRRDVEILIEQGAFEEAHRRIDEHRAHLPNLSVYADLERLLGLSEARQTTSAKDRIGLLAKLVARFPRDEELLHLYVQTCAELGNPYYTEGLKKVRVLLEIDESRYRRDPAVLDVARGYVLKVEHRHNDRDHAIAHEVIAEHLYDTVRDFLLEYVYNTDPSLHVPRWNAFLLMQRKQDPDLDEFRFYVCAFLAGDVVWSDWTTIKKYFDTLRATETEESIAERITFEVNELPVLRKQVAEDRMKTFVAVLAKPLEKQLLTGAVDETDLTYRLNCYRALEDAGIPISDDVRLRHHLLNLEYGRGRVYSQWLHDSIDYFIGLKDPSAAAEALPALEAIQVELHEEIARHTREGFPSMAKRARLLEAHTNEALRHLKG